MTRYQSRLLMDELLMNFITMVAVPLFQTLNNLGIAYLEKGLHDLAIKHIDQAVKLGYEVAPEILDEIEKYR